MRNKTASIVRILVFASPLTGITASGSTGKARICHPRFAGFRMYPGIFSTESTAALEKMAKTLEAFAAAGINTLFILIRDTPGDLHFRNEIGIHNPARPLEYVITIGRDGISHPAGNRIYRTRREP